MNNANMRCTSITSTDSPFVAPECRTLRLHGQVYGHPALEDGSWVTTSRVLDANWEEGKVQTKNTLYNIMTLDKDFVEYCEGIKEPGPGTKEFLQAAPKYQKEDRA